MEFEIADKKEFIISLISYIACFFYSLIIFEPNCSEIGVIVVALFIIISVEMLNKDKQRSKEGYLWLIMFIVVVLCFLYKVLCLRFGIQEKMALVFDDATLFLFIHLFAIWYVLERSHRFIAGESSKYFIIDAVNGLLIIPISNIFRRIKTVVFGIKESKKQDHSFSSNEIVKLIAIVLSVVLFFFAGTLLMESDDGFYALVNKIFHNFSFEFNVMLIPELILSIFVGMYLCGLILGSKNLPLEILGETKNKIDAVVLKIKKLSSGFFAVVIGIFSIMYVAYFILQGSYLFGAFTRTLPEGFIVSEYARKGFFELCKLLTVNFALIYLATRMNKDDESKLFQISIVSFFIESIMFTIIAFSKLYLYISCFGFTPLRFQSAWLIIVLFAACIAWLLSFLTGRKTVKGWIYFSAVSLCILCVY